MILEIAILLIGLVALYFGSNWFIDGSVNLARILGVRPFVIGLTIVAFGTSAPEAALSVLASKEGAGGVVLGNIIGSNIANIGLILGTSAILTPLIIHYAGIRIELFWMLGSMILMVLLGLDGDYSLLDGIVCLLVFVVFLITLYRAAIRSRSIRADAAEMSEDLSSTKPFSKPRCIAAIILGLAILLIGAQSIVTGAVGLATQLGISEFIIGVTIVSVGTSLPELAVSVMGVRKGDSEIAVSNIVGSNIFNSLFVLGLAIMAGVFTIPTSTTLINGVVMIVFGLALFLMSKFSNLVRRNGGILLLALYALFIIYTVS
jgi:cation:H+ antiporter